MDRGRETEGSRVTKETETNETEKENARPTKGGRKMAQKQRHRTYREQRGR